jgi:AcrR family transcriptional regulator
MYIVSMQDNVGNTPRPPGRPRNEQLRKAILDAAFLLEQRHGYSNVTVTQVAAEAGVGRQTVYRWWPTKEELYFDLVIDRAGQSAGLIDLETIGLEEYLCALFKLVRGQTGTIALSLLIKAQSDPDLSERIQQLFVQRRTILTTVVDRFAARSNRRLVVPTNVVVDMLAGAMWYRLLMPYAPLDDEFAHHLAQAIERLLG